MSYELGCVAKHALAKIRKSRKITYKSIINLSILLVMIPDQVYYSFLYVNPIFSINFMIQSLYMTLILPAWVSEARNCQYITKNAVFYYKNTNYGTFNLNISVYTYFFMARELISEVILNIFLPKLIL